MTKKFKIAEIKPDSLREGPISSQLRTVVTKWVSFAIRYFKEWDYKPGCGHFFGGVYNYGVETSATVMATATIAALGNYDENTIGVPIERLIDMTVQAIRYLCFTHHTGPADCVRETGRNPRTSGKKWGYTPGNFFMSSQTGVSVSMLGLSSWLMWEHLDEKTRDMVGGVLEFYADEYCEMTPGTGVYNDTQCEENAWTSLGIAAALYMFPEHPNSGKWMDGYINWSLNSVTTYKDKLNNEKDKVTGRSRNGFVHGDKSYGISSVTFHPDFTTENHGYVHPDYMGGGIILRASSAVFPLFRGEEPPGSLFYNFDNLYNKVLKPWCAADGNPVPVQGQDWYYHRHNNKLIMHAAMNLFFDDADAAMFERKCIDIMSRRQESTGKGRLLEKNGESLEVTPGLQSAFDMEYGGIRTVVLSYLLHLVKGDGTDPEYPATVMKKLSGNYMYPYGGVYIYRTPETFTSFTTRCSVMGLSMPAGGIWDITTDFQSFTGIIREKKTADEYYAKKKINWKDMGICTIYENIEEYEAGFSIIAKTPRVDEALMQMTSFTALPDGKAVYVEKVKAIRSVDIETFETGRISIGNENFRLLPECAKGYRDIFFNGRPTRFYGNYEGDDLKASQRGLKHVNVDGKIGYLLYGSGGVEYLNRHNYPKWKGLEDTLVLNKLEPCIMEAGDETDIFAVVTLPNTGINKMEKEYGNTTVTCSDADLFVVRTLESRISVNFSENGVFAEEKIPKMGNKFKIFYGRTSIRNGDAVCRYYIKGFASKADTLCGTLYMNDNMADIEITCADGFITAKNNAGCDISYVFSTSGVQNEVFHAAGEIINLPGFGED